MGYWVDVLQQLADDGRNGFGQWQGYGGVAAGHQPS